MQRERPVQTTLAFHASRIVIDVGVLLAMLAMSLPFVAAATGNRSALDADALPAILLLLPIFAVTLIPDHTRPIHPYAAWASLALGLAALPYVIVKVLDASILADTLDGSLGSGAYVMLIGSIVTLVGIGIGLYRNLRGLPVGGSPSRTSTYRTRSKSLTAPGRKPKPGRPEGKTVSEPAPATSQAAPPQEQPDEATSSGPEDDVEVSMPQPEILFPDEGAAERDAADEDETFTTAERADAAIDNDLLAMFDSDEDEGEQKDQ